MAESTETKFARMEGKIDNLTDKVGDLDIKLGKDYVTQDQLRLVIQEFKPYKQLVLWLLAIVASETIALLFYLIKTVLGK